MLWALEAEIQVYLRGLNQTGLYFYSGETHCVDPPGSFKAARLGGRKYLLFYNCGLIKLKKK